MRNETAPAKAICSSWPRALEFCSRAACKLHVTCQSLSLSLSLVLPPLTLTVSLTLTLSRSHTYIHRSILTYRHTMSYKRADIQIQNDIHAHTHRHTSIHADRRTHGRTDGQTDRRTYRHRLTCMHEHMHTSRSIYPSTRIHTYNIHTATYLHACTPSVHTDAFYVTDVNFCL